jgi:WD40 repeat protein
LLESTDPDIVALLDEVAAGAAGPWLRPIRASLPAPGSPLIWTLRHRTLSGSSHGRAIIHAVAATPGGELAVSGSSDGSLNIWDLTSGALLRSFQGHSEAVNALVAPDGHRAISASRDGTIKCWDLQRGIEARPPISADGSVNSLALSPDGTYVVSNSENGAIRVWNHWSGAKVATLQAHRRVNCVAASTDATWILAGCDDGSVLLWNRTRPKKPRTLRKPDVSESVSAVALSADGRRAIAEMVFSVLVWDFEQSATPRWFSHHANHAGRAFAVTQDWTTLVNATDTVVFVWDLQKRRERASLRAHTAVVDAAAVTRDGRHAVTGGYDGTVRFWRLAQSEHPSPVTHTTEVAAVGLGRQSPLAVSAGKGGGLQVWDLAHGAARHRLEPTPPVVSVLTVSPDGTTAVSGEILDLTAWDIESGKALWTVRAHTTPVFHLAISPDGRFAVSSGGADLTVTDIRTGSRQWSVEVSGSVGVTADSRFAICGEWGFAGSGGTMWVWDLEHGAAIRRLRAHRQGVTALVASGTTLVSGSYDETLIAWNTERWTKRRRIRAFVPNAMTIAGGRLAAGSHGGDLRVWDLESFDEYARLPAHTDAVTGLVADSTGRRLFSASKDRRICCWDLDNGSLIATFVADGAITSIGYSDHHETIIAGDSLGRVHCLRLAAWRAGPSAPLPPTSLSNRRSAIR